MLEIEEEEVKSQKKVPEEIEETKKEEEKIELFSVGHKIDLFNRIMLQNNNNNSNNLVSYHKSTTIASACFRQIKKPIQIEYNEVDVIGKLNFFLNIPLSLFNF